WSRTRGRCRIDAETGEKRWAVRRWNYGRPPTRAWRPARRTCSARWRRRLRRRRRLVIKPSETEDSWRRGGGAVEWLAACGVVAAALDVLVTAGLAALDPGYSHARQYISELGEPGRPYAAAFNAWSVAYGVLFAAFAVAAGRGLPSRSVLAALLAVS